jgi:hypothetical protein
MMSQNPADAKRQVIADQQWQTVQEEGRQNVQLLELSKQILELTKAVHAYAAARSDGVALRPTHESTGGARRALYMPIAWYPEST